MNFDPVAVGLALQNNGSVDDARVSELEARVSELEEALRAERRRHTKDIDAAFRAIEKLERRVKALESNGPSGTRGLFRR
ncbi:MAG: hypothetical protein Q4Q62_08720 [Thermoplasmata archaeon]|nr:hypothetical protein [Thermoplasmata archaeon]